MWILIIVTILATDPIRISYDSVARFETGEQCDKTAAIIVKHNPESRIFCVREK